MSLSKVDSADGMGSRQGTHNSFWPRGDEGMDWGGRSSARGEQACQGASRADSSAIVVVTGLPRSGTSLMMRMLEQGGLPVLVDSQRPADVDNPLGYYEFAPARRLQSDVSWLPQARGKAVKLVSLLVSSLPPGHQYQVLLMRRSLDEVLASQQKMLLRLGQPWRAEDDGRLRALYEQQLKVLERELEGRSDVTVLDVAYHRLVRDSEQEVSRVVGFLNRELNQDLMIRAVDIQLYRNLGAGR